MATYKIEGQTYQFPDDMPDDEVQTALSGILGGTSMQAEEPKQGDFLESFVNAAKLEGLGKNAAVDYMALVGNYREAKALAEQHARDYPSSGAGQFLGSVVGGIPQSAAALVPILNIAALSNFALRAGGQARFTVAQQREAGADIGPMKEAAAVVGYGALTYAAERLGFKKLRGVIDTMSHDALSEVGKVAISGSKKELAKAIGKRLAPTAMTMGLWEGTEEAFEQAGTNIIDKMYMDRSIFEGVPQAFGAGTLGGMMLAPAFAVKASFDMKQAMKQKDAAGDDTAFNGSTFEESKADLARKEPVGTSETEGTTDVLLPPGMKFVTEAQLPNEAEGRSTSAVERAAYEQSIEPVAEPKKMMPFEGELHFQQSDGTTTVIPITAEVRAKQKARLLATGLVNQVLEHEGQIWFKDGKQVPEGTPGAQMALGGVDREGNVHLSNRIAFNTIGHELFELAWTTLERLKNPVIQRGLDLFGGKERLADLSGNYWAANPQYDKPNTLRQFGRWVQNLFTEFKNVIGVEISQEEVGRYINTRIGELAAGKLAPQIMKREGLSFQATSEPIPLPSYFGNKRALVGSGIFDKIVGKFSNIVDVFGGSGYFGNVIGPTSNKVLNDLDPSIVSFHKLTSTQEGARKVYDKVVSLGDKLVALYEQFPQGGEHARQKAIALYNEFKQDTSPEGRAATLWFEHSSFTSANKYPIFVQKGDVGWKSKPINIKEQASKILSNPDYLKHSTLSSKQADVLLRESPKDALILLDPPYVSYEKGKSAVQKYPVGKGLQTREGALRFIKEDIAAAVKEGKHIIYTNHANKEIVQALKDVGMLTQTVARNRWGTFTEVEEVVGYTPNLSGYFAGEMQFQSAGAARTQARLDQQEDVLKKERSFWKNFWPDVKRKWVDTSSNVRNELLKYGAAGQKAIEQHDLVKGATARAAEIMRGAEKNIFGGLTPFEDKLLARIAQVRREIALYESNPQRYANFAQSAQDGKEWLAELDQGTASKLMPRVDALFAQYREMLDEALAEQLITPEAHTKMAAVGPYLTREHMDYIDPLTYTIRGEKMSVRDSGFYRTRDLDEDVVNNDMRMLLFEYAARLSSRAYKNRANRELLKLAQENPDNPLVRLHQEGTSTVPPKGFAPVSMFVDGKEQLVFMPEDMAVEWIVTDPMIKAQLGRWLGWVSGTTPLKMMATGMNPAFAIANFPRDLAHIFLTTNEYSSSLFVALPQMSADLVATAKDAWNKTGAYHDFVMQGGGMSFLTHQGQRSKTPTDRTGYMMQQLGQLQDFFGFLGEFTETWTRLALRNRALKRALASGMSQEEAESHATWVARNYLDFSQGGSYAKALDTVVPYLNASIQGTRGLVRAAKANPTIFAYKAGQLGMVAGSLALANALVNPDIWDEISEDEKNNYFIITRPELSFTDKEGNQRHMYIRIAKDQGQKLLATIFEAGALAAVGKPVDSERFVKAAAELLPIVPDGTLLPPLVDAIIGYIYNKDFYKNEDIWKGEDLSQRGLEFTSATNPAYIRLAELTPVLAPGSSNLPVLGQELSPERTRYAVEQIFVRGNPFSWLVGTGFREMMKDMPGKDLERTKQEIWSNFPGVNRMVKTTYPGLRYKKDVEQMRKEENTRLLKMRRDLDELVENDMVERSPETRRALREFISKADRSDKARLKEREEWTRRLADQPNRQWWLSVATLNPELRATAFYARWAQEDPETRSQLERQARSIPGVSTVRFRRQLRLLQRSGQRTIEP